MLALTALSSLGFFVVAEWGRVSATSMAEETGVVAADLPVKRPREKEENGAAAAAAAATTMEVDGTSKEPGCISAVIPGWFSEISPMWPGVFPCLFNLNLLSASGL